MILLLVACFLLLVAAYLLLSGDGADTSGDTWDDASADFDGPSAAALPDTADSPAVEARVQLFFGSQTGTAEGFCDELKKEAAAHGFAAECVDLEEISGDDLVALAAVGDAGAPPRDGDGKALPTAAVFVVATYGEGDPTDNAAAFYRWMTAKDAQPTRLSGLVFSVFGLGNTQYEHYNSMGRETAKLFAEQGARVGHAYGEGDDDPRPDGSIEDDFEMWHAAGGASPGGLWRDLRAALGLEVGEHSADGGAGAALRKASVEFNGMLLADDGGEWCAGGGVSGAAVDEWKAPKVPRKMSTVSRHFFAAFPAHLVARRELCSADAGRSVVHVELALDGTHSPLVKGGGASALYDTAANMGVVAENDAHHVESFAKLLRFGDILDRRAVLKPEVSTGGGDAKHLFPSPSRVGDIFARYCDMNSTPTRKELRRWAPYATDATERAVLAALAARAAGGASDPYAVLVQQPRLSLLELLSCFDSFEVEWWEAAQLTPPLKPRIYTVASSSAVHPTIAHLTVSVVEEALDAAAVPADEARAALALLRGAPCANALGALACDVNRRFAGVCTNFLARLGGDAVPECARKRDRLGTPRALVYVAPSTFPLPPSTTPLILIGPGTGIAPMRAILQQRDFARGGGSSSSGGSRMHRSCGDGAAANAVGDVSLYFGCQVCSLTSLGVRVAHSAVAHSTPPLSSTRSATHTAHARSGARSTSFMRTSCSTGRAAASSRSSTRRSLGMTRESAFTSRTCCERTARQYGPRLRSVVASSLSVVGRRWATRSTTRSSP